MQKPHRVFLLARQIRFSSTESTPRSSPRLSTAWGDISIPSQGGNARQRQNTESIVHKLRKEDDLSHIIYPDAQQAAAKPSLSVEQPQQQQQAAPVGPVIIPIPSDVTIKGAPSEREFKTARTNSSVPQNRQQKPVSSRQPTPAQSQHATRQHTQADRQRTPSRTEGAKFGRNNRSDTDVDASRRRTTTRQRSKGPVTGAPHSRPRAARSQRYDDDEDEAQNRRIAELFNQLDLTALKDEIDPAELEEIRRLESGEEQLNDEDDDEFDEVDDLLGLPEAEFEERLGLRFERAATVSAETQLSSDLAGDYSPPPLHVLDQVTSADLNWALKRFGGDYDQYSHYTPQALTEAIDPVHYAKQTVSQRNDIGVNARQEMSKRIHSSVSRV